MSSPKAARILRRTLSGGALIASLALLLWWTSRSGDGAPLFWVAAIVLAGALFETARMGQLRALPLAVPFVVAGLGALALTQVARLSANGEHALGDAPLLQLEVYRGELVPLYLWVLLLAASSYALIAAFSAWRVLAGIPVRVLALAVGGFALWVVCARRFETLSRLPVIETWLAILFVVSLPLTILRRELGRLLIAVGLCLWIIPPLAMLWSFWHSWGMGALIGMLALSKIGDSAGYYVGGAIGRSHPFPSISPGKTTAGCVASFVAAVALGAILSAAGVLPAGHTGLRSGLILGGLTNLAAQAGDLFESWVKRRAAVKDSSTVFGPSGGLLDQLDSLLFSIPVASFTWAWILE